MSVDILNIGDREVTAPHAGLIGNDEQQKPRILQSFKRRPGSGKNGHCLGTMKILFFFDQRPVAI